MPMPLNGKTAGCYDPPPRDRYEMIHRVVPHILLLLLLFAAATSHGAVRGEVDLRYTDYSVRGTDSDRLDATSFTQRYAVSYYKDNRPNTQKRYRYIEYDYLLGYEWISFDTSVTTASTDENRKFHAGRLYYAGEVTADPPKLPLRMRLYSRDMQRPSVATRSLSVGTTSILDTPVADDIYGTGRNIENGANILFGVKGGMDNHYADSLAHLPLFMLDFKERITKNDSPYSRVDTRLTELAFVSLNRKDNWFHLRYKVFDDRINPNSNWKERQYQIGTVDVRRQRKWVDLTNWIKVSADGLVTRHTAPIDRDSFDDYAMNLFFRATRRTWQMNSFSSFDRMVRSDSIETTRRIPLSLSGRYGTDTSWSISVSLRDRQLIDGVGGKRSESSQGATGRINLFNRKPFTLSPSLSVNRTKDSTGVAYLVKGALETTSTPRLSVTTRLRGLWSAEIHLKNSAQGYGAGDDEYLSQMISLSAYWHEGTQNADVVQEFSHSIPIDSSWRGRSNNDSRKSRTTASVGWVPSMQLNTSLSGTLSFEDEAASGWRRSGSIYGNISWRPDEKLHTRFRIGRSFSRSENGTSDRVDNIIGSLEWTPDRDLFLKADYSDSSTLSGGVDSPSRSFDQLLRYSWHPSFVLSRRYLDLEEEFKYVQNASSVTTSSVRFGLRWFPTRRLSLYGNLSTYVSGYDQSIYNVGGNIDLHLLQASLDYSQGKRSGTDQRTEKRWTASIRRSF
ncbi:MAG: hypothetical protein Fur0034_15210 [Desulfuromonadia bacterium]